MDAMGSIRCMLECHTIQHSQQLKAPLQRTCCSQGQVHHGNLHLPTGSCLPAFIPPLHPPIDHIRATTLDGTMHQYSSYVACRGGV
jgi:hypothetical protein